jgi:hypothetical protein
VSMRDAPRQKARSPHDDGPFVLLQISIVLEG